MENQKAKRFWVKHKMIEKRLQKQRKKVARKNIRTKKNKEM